MILETLLFLIVTDNSHADSHRACIEMYIEVYSALQNYQHL